MQHRGRWRPQELNRWWTEAGCSRCQLARKKDTTKTFEPESCKSFSDIQSLLTKWSFTVEMFGVLLLGKDNWLLVGTTPLGVTLATDAKAICIKYCCSNCFHKTDLTNVSIIAEAVTAFKGPQIYKSCWSFNPQYSSITATKKQATDSVETVQGVKYLYSIFIDVLWFTQYLKALYSVWG